MSGRKKPKANIQMSKPELPPFLQRIKEQIVANEDSTRREESERRRKERPTRPAGGDDDDDPTVVKLNSDDLTQEEYDRMKTDLKTKYKIDDDDGRKKETEELDIDRLIESKSIKRDEAKSSRQGRSNISTSKRDLGDTSRTKESKPSGKPEKAKTLSYGSSSEDESD